MLLGMDVPAHPKDSAEHLANRRRRACDGVKKSVEEHMVEVRLLLLLHHQQVHLPLLLLLPLDQLGVL